MQSGSAEQPVSLVVKLKVAGLLTRVGSFIFKKPHKIESTLAQLPVTDLSAVPRNILLKFATRDVSQLPRSWSKRVAPSNI